MFQVDFIALTSRIQVYVNRQKRGAIRPTKKIFQRRWQYAVGLSFFIIFLSMVNVHLSEAVSVDGSRKPATTKPERKRVPLLKGNYQYNDISLKILLPPAAEKEQRIQKRKNEPLQVGFGRDVPDPYNKQVQDYFTWYPLKSGGQTTVFTVTSPGAAAIRLAIRADEIPQGTEIRFFSVLYPEQIFGPFNAQHIVKQTKNVTPRADLFWSPVMEGETIGVEVYAASPDGAANLSFAIPKVSHLTYSPRDSSENHLSKIGESGNCNIDVVCRTTNPVKDAVAKIIFTKDGNSFACTGTLLNDTDDDSYTAYFMTANHCLSTQDTADTINSYWFFERETCNGADPTYIVQRTGGGELLSTKSTTDYSFLQLNAEMPDDVYYAGWDSAALSQNATVTCIHHPAGDLKKWS